MVAAIAAVIIAIVFVLGVQVSDAFDLTQTRLAAAKAQ